MFVVGYLIFNVVMMLLISGETIVASAAAVVPSQGFRTPPIKEESWREKRKTIQSIMSRRKPADFKQNELEDFLEQIQALKNADSNEFKQLLIDRYWRTSIDENISMSDDEEKERKARHKKTLDQFLVEDALEKAYRTLGIRVGTSYEDALEKWQHLDSQTTDIFSQDRERRKAALERKADLADAITTIRRHAKRAGL